MMTPATLLSFDGETKSIVEWALDYGVTPDIIIARLARGQTAVSAITTPMSVCYRGQKLPVFHKSQKQRTRPRRKPADQPRPRNNAPYEFDGQSHTLHEWADITGIPYSCILYRLNDGWTIERMLTTPHRPRRQAGASSTPGVASDLSASIGTGAGSTAQESVQIDFHDKAIAE